jgi:hypothetical protein
MIVDVAVAVAAARYDSATDIFSNHSENVI